MNSGDGGGLGRWDHKSMGPCGDERPQWLAGFERLKGHIFRRRLPRKIGK
jgi:hypothetical protein